jgi:hypothetical protein
MSLSLLTFNNDIMDIIVNNIDYESHLIVGLTCKEMYKILKTTNDNKKLSGSLKYLTSTLSLLKYAHFNKCPLNLKIIENILNVTNKESLECLNYAHENGCVWIHDICMLAARNGHLKCLKYLHENGCGWTDDTCGCAAENGHLECLKYLHENGCPWDIYTCNDAAKNGHLECLKYCHENGCPWQKETSSEAAKYGHLECLKYCKDNGCPE